MIIVTRYSQRNKDTVLCKRNIFKRGKLSTIDSEPISEEHLNELIKGHSPVFTVNVEKKSDLALTNMW